MVHAVSDPRETFIKRNCLHVHEEHCSQCDEIRIVLDEINEFVKQASFDSEDDRDEVLYITKHSMGWKGPADRTAATIKGHITRYVNEGNDVTNAKEMEKAMLSDGGLQGIRVIIIIIIFDISIALLTIKDQCMC